MERGCRTCGGKCDEEQRLADRSLHYRLEAYKWAKARVPGNMRLALSCMNTSAKLRRRLAAEFGWPSVIPQ